MSVLITCFQGEKSDVYLQLHSSHVTCATRVWGCSGEAAKLLDLIGPSSRRASHRDNGPEPKRPRSPQTKKSGHRNSLQVTPSISQSINHSAKAQGEERGPEKKSVQGSDTTSADPSPSPHFVRNYRCCCDWLLLDSLQRLQLSRQLFAHSSPSDQRLVAASWKEACLVDTMSGTMRGTPGRNQGRGNVPFAANSPSNSNIPRPVLDPQPNEAASSVSASRQKQSKRDEVRETLCLPRNLSNRIPLGWDKS